MKLFNGKNDICLCHPEDCWSDCRPQCPWFLAEDVVVAGCNWSFALHVFCHRSSTGSSTTGSLTKNNVMSCATPPSNTRHADLRYETGKKNTKKHIRHLVPYYIMKAIFERKGMCSSNGTVQRKFGGA